MQIWQRGTAFTNLSYAYTADRWAAGPFTGTQQVSQNASVPSTTGASFPYSLKLQRPSGSTSTAPFLIGQTIESINCYDLSGQSITLSFWAKAGANFSGATMGVQVNTGTVADQGGSSYYTWTGLGGPINTGVTLTTTWTKYTFTGTVGAGVLEMIAVFFFTGTGTAGADDSFYITGVQLEPGPVATPFERKLYGQVLTDCQRYFVKLGGTTAYEDFGTGWFTTTTAMNFWATMPVQLRVIPTLVQTGTLNAQNFNNALYGASSFSINSTESGLIRVGVSTVVAGATANVGGIVRAANDLSASLQFSAEL